MHNLFEFFKLLITMESDQDKRQKTLYELILRLLSSEINVKKFDKRLIENIAADCTNHIMSNFDLVREIIIAIENDEGSNKLFRSKDEILQIYLRRMLLLSTLSRKTLHKMVRTNELVGCKNFVPSLDEFNNTVFNQLYETLIKSFDKKELCYFIYKKLFDEELFFKDSEPEEKLKILDEVESKLTDIVIENSITEDELLNVIMRYIQEYCGEEN